jgi:uncharacterized OB-fold protein
VQRKEKTVILEPWIEADAGESVATMRRDGQIVGSVCLDCGQAAFPPVLSCRNCHRENQVVRTLASHGVLYSYTVVRVSSGREVPYTVGYVDLADGVRVLGDLDIELETLACGLDVRLGEGRSGWAFQSSEVGR